MKDILRGLGRFGKMKFCRKIFHTRACQLGAEKKYPEDLCVNGKHPLLFTDFLGAECS